jgi:hypothetical protein
LNSNRQWYPTIALSSKLKIRTLVAVPLLSEDGHDIAALDIAALACIVPPPVLAPQTQPFSSNIMSRSTTQLEEALLQQHAHQAYCAQHPDMVHRQLQQTSISKAVDVAEAVGAAAGTARAAAGVEPSSPAEIAAKTANDAKVR